MLKKVQLKTKQELLKMGYEYNDNPEDFLNLMSGQIVTLDLDSTRKASCGGIIYFSIEYPEYIIYDYLIKRVMINKKPIMKDDVEYTYTEIGITYGFTMQRSEQILKQALKKMKKIVSTYNETPLDFVSSSNLSG